MSINQHLVGVTIMQYLNRKNLYIGTSLLFAVFAIVMMLLIDESRILNANQRAIFDDLTARFIFSFAALFLCADSDYSKRTSPYIGAWRVFFQRFWGGFNTILCAVGAWIVFQWIFNAYQNGFLSSFTSLGGATGFMIFHFAIFFLLALLICIPEWVKLARGIPPAQPA